MEIIMNFLLLQIGVEGFSQAAEVSTLMGVLVSIIIILGGVVVYLFTINQKKGKELFELQSNTTEKTHTINKDHIERLDEIRKEIMQKEDLRSKENKDTEREILSILNGLSQILELREAKNKNENIVILDKLNEINKKLNTTIDALMNRKR